VLTCARRRLPGAGEGLVLPAGDYSRRPFVLTSVRSFSKFGIKIKVGMRLQSSSREQRPGRPPLASCCTPRLGGRTLRAPAPPHARAAPPTRPRRPLPPAFRLACAT
jgi:hypothetical protein